VELYLNFPYVVPVADRWRLSSKYLKRFSVKEREEKMERNYKKTES
jgi:hypothetical protein